LALAFCSRPSQRLSIHRGGSLLAFQTGPDQKRKSEAKREVRSWFNWRWGETLTLLA
jgi:hypothetical protein